MKNKSLFIILLFVVISCSFADEYLIGTISGIRKDKAGFLNFKYNDSNNEFYFNYSDSLWDCTYWFTLTPGQLGILRNSLNKAVQWSKIAKEKAVAELNKEIPSSTLNVSATMKWAGDWYNSKSPIMLKFCFWAKNGTSGIVIVGNKSRTLENPFTNIEWESFVITEAEINSLINMISQENINSYKNKHNARKQLEDLFN